MLGKGRGGLEQVALDYHHALSAKGHQVITTLAPDSWAATQAELLNYSTFMLNNRGEWDIFAAFKLRSLAKSSNSDAIICHGNRAIRLALKLSKGTIPIIAVAHNYKNKSFKACDAVFCITQDLSRHIKALGFRQEMIFHVPNMVYTDSIKHLTGNKNTMNRIGSLGRFVEKKGFDILLDAIAIAHNKISFTAAIGGNGPLENHLKSQCDRLGIAEIVTFTGWVEDKNKFFNEIDLFILPSRHEPFGIVLIEAMAQGLPCISLPSEGPSEIITNNCDGIIVQSELAEDLAEAIINMLNSPDKARSLGFAGKELVSTKYSDRQIAETLDVALNNIIRLTTTST